MWANGPEKLEIKFHIRSFPIFYVPYHLLFATKGTPFYVKATPFRLKVAPFQKIQGLDFLKRESAVIKVSDNCR